MLRMIVAYLWCLRGKQIHQTWVRDDPCLYGISRAVWNLQTGSYPIKSFVIRSVRISHIIKGCNECKIGFKQSVCQV